MVDQMFLIEFQNQLLNSNIMKITMSNNESFSIGLGGFDKNHIDFRPEGFVVHKDTSHKWYSYAQIVSIEVF